MKNSSPIEQRLDTPVFIVSTGRSGSQMISQVLALHPLICSLHEPHPHLRAEAFTKWAGTAKKELIEKRIKKKRDDLIRQIRMNEFAFVESSHYVSHLIDEVCGMYQAKIVHQCRDGRDFVRSGLERGWYRDQSIDRKIKTWLRRKFLIEIGDAKVDHRLIPPAGLTTRFEKITWLWAEMHRTVINSLEKIPKERQFFLRIEDIDRQHIAGLLEFMEVPFDDGLLDRMLEVAMSRPGKSRKNTSPRPDEWPDADKKRFWELAGTVMEQLGYR
ncbi:MAG: sulfotransferase domain-containing protein [Nitrospirota bacterium]|nr:sulfotransferase domain-containing protein [Nitrospirota bacterium]